MEKELSVENEKLRAQLVESENQKAVISASKDSLQDEITKKVD